MVKIDGRELRGWRERRLLTLRDLAAKSGVQFHTIHAIETGKQEPRLSTVRKLVAALGIEPEDIWPSADERPAVNSGSTPESDHKSTNASS